MTISFHVPMWAVWTLAVCTGTALLAAAVIGVCLVVRLKDFNPVSGIRSINRTLSPKRVEGIRIASLSASNVEPSRRGGTTWLQGTVQLGKK
jgi:hypothetical protein